MSKFYKDQMILPRMCFDLINMQMNLSRVLSAGGHTYTLINAYGRTIKVGKAEIDSSWFSVFSKDKTLALYESQVCMAAVLYPGNSVSQLLMFCPGLGSTQKINAALERIRAKGFAFIDCFLSGI